ncbi:MAG: LLM class F420-dependent oxidoreductase [Acidimicrobiia bacterium]|nr:LLM class F420-dependent oxidoreductase [Acidimicrobiia bacterium]
MRIGIITPVVLLLPRSHNAWEESAGVDDLVAVARAADRLGYHHLTASEHVAVPVDVDPRRGHRYWDLLATLSYLAALTERIRLVTNIVVLPYHHPLEVVKHYSTLDLLSGSRLVLGVGVGSLEEEFALLGKPFAGRGDVADDAIRAIRAAWGRVTPDYAGSHFRFEGLVVEPASPREDVPIWVGGRTRRSLRRAVELGDAWMPFLLDLDAVREMLDWAHRLPAWEERNRPLDVVLWPEPAVDPLTDTDTIRRQADAYIAAGTTVLNYRFRSDSTAHHIEQMEALTHILDLDWETGVGS